MTTIVKTRETEEAAARSRARKLALYRLWVVLSVTSQIYVLFFLITMQIFPWSASAPSAWIQAIIMLFPPHGLFGFTGIALWHAGKWVLEGWRSC
jgi:hypothetical protein